MDLSPIARFAGVDTQFRLTKVGTKRDNHFMGEGQSRVGYFSLFKYPRTQTLPEATGILVGSLKTSPIVKVIDFGQDFTLFETEGSTYRLEKLEKENQ